MLLVFLFVLFLIWSHFIADFICQTDKMAVNKSSSIKWLTIHCATYSLIMFIILNAGLSIGYNKILIYSVGNGFLHLIIDGITSRVAKSMWLQEKRHAFFVIIGLDQALHLTCLILTSLYFIEG